MAYIDYDHDAVNRRGRIKPKMIIAGYSAYSRVIDWQAFADVAKEVGAMFMVDMAHFAGLAATGVYPNRRCRSRTSSRAPRTRRCVVRAAV